MPEKQSKYIPFSICKPDNLLENIGAALLPMFLSFLDSVEGTWLHIHIPSPHAVSVQSQSTSKQSCGMQHWPTPSSPPFLKLEHFQL